MRALVVTSMYPPHHLGGYEQSCRDVVRRWEAAGHEVHVLTTDTRLAGVTDEPQPRVTRALRWYWRDHRIVRRSWPGRLRAERHNRRVLARALAATRPDVVSVWAMGAMSLGLVDALNASGLPTVFVVCDEWPVYGPRLDGWLASYAGPVGRRLGPLARAATGLPVRLVEPRAASFCWLSEHVRARTLAATGWHPARETVTHSGIDTDDFPVGATPPRDGWRWRLLCVGRVEPRKGFSVAVEALVDLPEDARLRIVGPDDGSHAAELAALARRLGVERRVTFEPARPRPRLRELYASADAVLFTSAWQEPFGLVPVEAMACSTPVVAHATGGSAEYLTDGVNCLVAPPGDPRALAAAVRRLAGDAALRATLVAGGQATAGRLSADRLSGLLEQEHLAAIAARRGDLSRPPPMA